MIGAAVLAAALVLGTPVAAEVPDVAAALAGDPLYLDPDAQGAFTDTETGQLRERLRTATTPVYLAVLPGRAGGPSPEPAAAPGLAAAIAVEAGRPGTYGVVSGTDFRAVSTLVGDRAPELAEAALAAVAAGAETVTALLEFVDQVEVAASQAEGPLPGGPGDEDAETRQFSAPDPWVVAFVAVGGLVVLGMRRRRRG